MDNFDEIHFGEVEVINCDKLWSADNNNIDTNDNNDNYCFNKIYFGEREVINVRSCRALIRSVFCAGTAVVPETYGHMYSTNTFTFAISQPILLLSLKLRRYFCFHYFLTNTFNFAESSANTLFSTITY